jgi:hypothetical protein
MLGPAHIPVGSLQKKEIGSIKEEVERPIHMKRHGRVKV